MRVNILVILGLLLFLAVFPARLANAQTQSQATTETNIAARVTLTDEAARRRFLALNLDVLEMREGDDLFIVTTPDELARLQRAGWKAQIDEAQTRNVRMSPNTFNGGYRTVVEMRAFVDSKAAQYPNLAEVFIYGQSWERINRGPGFGSDLFGLRLTNRNRAGPKPTLFLMAAIHARELATAELALRLIDHLLTNYGTDGDITWLLDEHQIVIVPVVNPDGRALAQNNLSQRKNTNNTNGAGCANPPTSSNQFGVDLNRNYSWRWGTVNPPSENPCGQTFPGPVVASEPETQAIQTLVRSLFADQRGPGDSDAAPADATGLMLTLHSYSNLVLWPWGDINAAAPNGADLALIGGKLGAYTGFTPQQAIQLYATSGTTDDWSYGELGIASFTFEVGPSSGGCSGFFPAFSCLDGGTGGNFWNRTLPAFLYTARLARAPYLLGRGPAPETATASGLPNNQVEISAQLNDQNNGNQNIVAAEYYVDTPPWAGGAGQPMNALDGVFNSALETATATLSLTGNHLVYVRGRDAAGNWGPARGVFSSPGAACAYNVTPATQSFGASGGTGSFNLNAGLGCAWTATANAVWLSVTNGLSGNGNAAVNFAVAANTGLARSGTFTIAGQTITINQASATPLLQLSATNYVVAENSGAMTFTVTRTGEASLPVAADYATQDSFAFTDCSATGNLADQRCDYAPVRGTLNFAAGEMSKSFTVLLNDDLYRENNETLTVALNNPNGASLGAISSATLTITDDDFAPAAVNPLETARFFVRQQYADFLAREPDAAGWDYWTGQIAACGADLACARQRRVAVSNAFFFEQEYQQTGAFVYRLYKAAFGVNAGYRPSYPQFVGDVARLAGGSTKLALANDFSSRLDFLEAYPARMAPAEFVDALIRNAQNGSGVNLNGQRGTLLSLYEQGGRALVLRELVDERAGNPVANQPLVDAEYNRAVVLTQYFGYLRRETDAGGYQFWLALLNRYPLRSPLGQNSMVCAFITSAEYQQRFSATAPRGNSECPPAP